METSKEQAERLKKEGWVTMGYRSVYKGQGRDQGAGIVSEAVYSELNKLFVKEVRI